MKFMRWPKCWLKEICLFFEYSFFFYEVKNGMQTTWVTRDEWFKRQKQNVTNYGSNSVITRTENGSTHDSSPK